MTDADRGADANGGSVSVLVLAGGVLVLVGVLAAASAGAGPAAVAGADGDGPDGADLPRTAADAGPAAAAASLTHSAPGTGTPADERPVARCSVSRTTVVVGEPVTLDASASENADDFQYDRDSSGRFGEYTNRETTTVEYSEPGTYRPRVKVWAYPSERSDTTVCGTVDVVAEPTATPTPASPTGTPVRDPVASCRVPEERVEVDELVILDARESENADDFQFARDADTSFGSFTSEGFVTVRYDEPGTYRPRVKVWAYPSEQSDTASCGTVTVVEATPSGSPTPTPPPTPTPTPTLTPPPTASPTPTPGPTATPPPTPTFTPPSTASPTPSATPTPTPTPTASPTPTATATPVPPGSLTADWWYEPLSPLVNETVRVAARRDEETGYTYEWDTDDDGSYEHTGRAVGFHFDAPGDHAVTLRVTGPGGGTARTARTITVRRIRERTTGPASDGNTSFLYAPLSPQTDESVTLIAVPSGPVDDVTGYAWDLDDDGTVDERGRLLERPGLVNATNPVVLYVNRSGGATETVRRQVPVAPPGSLGTPPTAPGTTTSGDGGPGFGLGLATVAVALALVVRVRRGRSR